MAALFVLSGCTKKEELLLISEENAAGEQAETVETSEAPPAEKEQEDVSQTGQAKEIAAPVQTEPDVICVHVCGAVKQPGVYELRAGSRVYEAVQAAGGFDKEADRDYVNQAQELADGTKLVIPTLEEAEKARDREFTAVTETENAAQDKGKNAKVNINTASEAQLCDIPGIGATRAAAITAYRESHGGFQKPEDIMKVNGIKEGMYEKIKDSICVN